MKSHNAYARVGVDVDIEARASRILYQASKKTFKNRRGLLGEIVAPFDDFAGLKMIAVGGLPRGSYVSMGFDTAGTKVEIAQRVGTHDTIAFDLLAMVCDDALVRGGEPILVGTNLDITTLGTDEKLLSKIRELGRGYVAAAKEANVAIINGEIAQMGHLVSGFGPFSYHWGAACLWAAKKDKLFTGNEIQAGDAVVVLREDGFRTNGLSLVRSIFGKKYGEAWHTIAHATSTLGRLSLTPSKIYSRFIVKMHGGFDQKGTGSIHGIAHITGGGVPEKMRRVLRRGGLGASLPNLFEPPEIMSHCQRVGHISDRDAYLAWNMGQGLAVITPDPDHIVREAKRMKIKARIAGEITQRPQIVIRSKGIEHPGSDMTF